MIPKKSFKKKVKIDVLLSSDNVKKVSALSQFTLIGSKADHFKCLKICLIENYRGEFRL